MRIAARSGGGWRRRAASRRAAVTVMFALTILPMLGFVALAFDVGSAVWARAQLDLAADAAAMAAVARGVNDYTVNPNTSFQPAQLAGTRRFSAQANQMPGVTLSAINVGVSRSGRLVSAAVTYGASYRTQFAGVLGFGSLQIGGAATVARVTSPFQDFEFLLDNSGSMAIAASQADMDRLGLLVRASPLFAQWGQGQNCAFACHFDPNNNDFYGLALANGVPLRLNVLTQAVTNVIQTLAASVSAASFRVGIHNFNHQFYTPYPISSNLPGSILAVQSLSVPFGTDPEDQTNVVLALQSLAAMLPAAGDGSSAASPLRSVFFVSDAVYDSKNGTPWRTLKAFDPSDCGLLKSKGIQVLTLYTQYIPLEPPYVPQANSFYQSSVKPFVGQLFPNMQSCASSPALAFQATDGPSINAALQSMLQSALSTPARFTQ